MYENIRFFKMKYTFKEIKLLLDIVARRKKS